MGLFFKKPSSSSESMENDVIQIAPDPDPNPKLSSIADSVIARCSRILFLSVEELQQSFSTKLPGHVRQHSTYARNLVEYCSFQALLAACKTPDYLTDKEFRLLTYDMMLAWEAPDPESESLLNDTASCKLPEVDEDDGSLYYISSTTMAIQVAYKKAVGLEAFARIAPACPPVADPITVHNLFDALTCCSGGRLHFLIYDKYLKSLNKTLKSAKSITGPPLSSNLHLAEGEIILDMDGVMPTKPILQHIGISTWPGRLTLTNHSLYFEPLGVVSYDKAVKYDLAAELKQVIKREMTGPWGARLFDKAVMYKSNSLADPICLEFPQLIGHSRRDYWFAIIREVLHVHRFIRKFNLSQIQRAEALSKAALGIFRYRALKEAFHVTPSRFKTTLAFNLAEKLPKGDKILEALNGRLELLCNKSKSDDTLTLNGKKMGDSFPVSFYALARMGFVSIEKEDWSEETELLAADAHVGETNALQKAVKESLGYSGKVEAARATLDQVKVEDIETNLVVIKELLFPLTVLGKRLHYLAEWEDPLKSTVFLLLTLYAVCRGWIRYLLPSIFLSLALIMLWHKTRNKGKQMEAFQITLPPNRNPVELILTLQETISLLETRVQAGCITLLKLRTILLSAFPKALNMATEFNIRVAEISRKETGLEGFKTRAEEAEVRALDAEKERDDLKGALEAEKKFSASSCEQVIALEAELGLLQKESAAAALHLAEEKEAAEKKAAEAELRAVKAENDLKAMTASLQAALREKAALVEAKVELERMCGQGFEAGFWECRDQIIRKFPDHGLDLTLLDSLEEGPEEEEEAEKEAEEAT